MSLDEGDRDWNLPHRTDFFLKTFYVPIYSDGGDVSNVLIV